MTVQYHTFTPPTTDIEFELSVLRYRSEMWSEQVHDIVYAMMIIPMFYTITLLFDFTLNRSSRPVVEGFYFDIYISSMDLPFYDRLTVVTFDNIIMAYDLMRRPLPITNSLCHLLFIPQTLFMYYYGLIYLPDIIFLTNISYVVNFVLSGFTKRIKLVIVILTTIYQIASFACYEQSAGLLPCLFLTCVVILINYGTSYQILKYLGLAIRQP